MSKWNKVILSGSRAELRDVTASYFRGDGSALTGIVASIAENSSFPFTFTSQTSFEVTHSLNTPNPIIQCYDSNNEQNIPEIIKIINDNVISITYPTAQSGRVVVAKCGHLISGSLNFANSSSVSVTSSYSLTASFVELARSSSFSISSSYSLSSSLAISSSYSLSSSWAPSLLEVKKDNTSIKLQTIEIDFTGSGVQVTDNGSGRVKVQITGSAGGVTNGITEAISMLFTSATGNINSTTTLPDGATIHRIQIKKPVVFDGTTPVVNIYCSGSSLLPLVTGSMSNLKSGVDDLVFDIYSVTPTTSGSILLSLTGSGATVGTARAYIFYTKVFNN